MNMESSSALGDFKINRKSAVPLYKQLAAQIESAIVDGKLENGTMLAAETTIAEQLSMSRPTVRKSIQSLVEKGLLERTRGVGTEIRFPANNEYSNFVEEKLRTSSGCLGLIVPDGSNPFFSEIAQVVQNQAWQRGWLTIWADSGERLEMERTLIKAIAQKSAGLILASPRLDDDTLQTAVDDTKIVTINRTIRNDPHVLVDVTTGMHQAVSHLAALGHKKIGYLGGPPHSRSDQLIKETLTRTCKKLGIDFQVIGQVSPNHRGGYSAGDLIRPSGVTAVIAHNDLIAIGLMARLTERGVRVPKDISVIGTDDIPFSSILNPSLTTVSINRHTIAQSAIDLLLSTIDGIEPPSRSLHVATQLVVRQSSGLVSFSKG